MIPAPPFTHVLRLSDGRGIRANAAGGYRVEDAARALVVMCREPRLAHDAARVAAGYFDFLLDSQAQNGAGRDAADDQGQWRGEPGVGDGWGRGLWALGTAAARSDDPWIRATAASRFDRGATRRGADLRAGAYAALGAAELLTVSPGHAPALRLLRDHADRFGPPDAAWPWPEPRLGPTSAAVADALVAAGEHLDDPAIRQDGLDRLGWLLAGATRDGHLSVTPVGGYGPGDPRPGFDQRPAEVAALADACVRAFDVTGDPRWAAGLDLAVGWFLGANDLGVPMWDPSTGGGFDALTATGPDRAQGAEATLSMVATLQQARRLTASSH